MKIAVILFGCLNLLSLAFFARNAAAAAPQPAAKDPNLGAVAEGCNQLAVDLYTRLAAENKGNLFFSPASIDTALAMTYAGAAGTTAEQMAKTLHYSLPNEKLQPAFAALLASLNQPAKGLEGKPAYQLSVASALWGEAGYMFKSDYLLLLQKNYQTALNPVEFKQPDAARKTINDWAAHETHDKIKDLIPPGVLNADTRLVLTNAIYFKSDWAEQFKKERTTDDEFTLAPGKTVKTPMMHQQDHFGYSENDALQVLSLPYAANQLDMFVLLPKQKDGLAEVEKSLAAGKLDDWLKPIKMETVKVSLPKFKFSSECMLSKTLQAVGMIDAFKAGKADFSGMTGNEEFFIGEVLHKAFVAVDENGTEAAAATAVMMKALAMPVQSVPKEFRADHPFVFLIRHRSTGAILFLGRVANPKE